MKTSQELQQLRAVLLAHYDKNGRSLPWRIRPKDREAGAIADPYKIWLSEIMCQQTSVTAAAPFWHKFLQKWPSVDDLANAPRDEVLTAWAGLGYYARARNLHKCACIVAHEYGGQFPKSEQGLLKLPGIGPYTAAAIASICWGEATNIVDGNVERVISRLRMVDIPLPKGKGEIHRLAGKIADPQRAGDYGQALMDLGSQICKPRNPKCGMCPWAFACKAKEAGFMEEYPKRLKKQKRPIRYGAVFYMQCGSKILLRKRADKGLLGGMMEVPGTEWTLVKQTIDTLLLSAPVRRNWQVCEQEVVHVFTHFTLHLTVFTAQVGKEQAGIWAHLDRLDDYALPSLMRKAIHLAQK
ncbi:MAG: A/G-specific adenine glycosylase [Robiginitomaculum sp.]|nr:A/G-specific adenine glycosylase [Robiginitomaculum sp.]